MDDDQKRDIDFEKQDKNFNIFLSDDEKMNTLFHDKENLKENFNYYFDHIKSKWLFVDKKNRAREDIRFVLSKFLQNFNTFSFFSFEDSIKREKKIITFLRDKVDDLFIEDIITQDQEEIYSKVLKQIEETINYCTNIYQSFKMVSMTTDINYNVGMNTNSTVVDKEKLYKDKHYLVEDMYNVAYTRGYKKYKDLVYKKKYYNDLFTYSYVKDKEIKDFVAQECSRDHNHLNWTRLVGIKGGIEEISKLLMETQTYHFSDIQASRYMISFRNGVYFLKTTEDKETYIPQFINYSQTEQIEKLRENEFSFKYFDLDYPEEIMNEKWEDIQTPNFDKIINYQFGDLKDFREIKRTLFILCGRLFYDVGLLDNWQVMVFLKGLGGTGKGTILDLFKYVFGQEAGSMSNNIEENFGLQSLYDKKIILGMEIGLNFKLNQELFQSMITGETMTVAIKNKCAIDIDNWTAPMILAGNNFPERYVDRGGSLNRRLIMFAFDKPVSSAQHDSELTSKIRSEVPYIITKMTKAYLETRNLYKNKKFSDIAPKYFKDQVTQLLFTTNPFYSFINSPKHIISNLKSYVRFTDLQKKYMKFSRDITGNVKKTEVSLDDIRKPIYDLAERLKKNIKIYQNNDNSYHSRKTYENGDIEEKEIIGDFIYGIGFNVEDNDNIEVLDYEFEIFKKTQ